MDKKDFDNFFEPYSKSVDDVDANSAFWRLSDQIIFDLINREALSIAKSGDVIFDAGGGTGRWIEKMSHKTEANFILFDKSKHMLDVAEKRISRANLESRVKIIEGDLAKMSNIPNNSVDYVTSIYSPISFIYDYKDAFSELNRILKPNGKILIMAHNYHNAISSQLNNSLADIVQISDLCKSRMVKWAPHVPPLVSFSKETIEQELKDAGFLIDKTYGIFVYVQPGFEDFNPKNEGVSKISKYLEITDNFNKIYEIEMAVNSYPSLVNRSMNLLSVGVKYG
jgi:ubiquinone/menaquinone biosynthesis C-methylase UbiE